MKHNFWRTFAFAGAIGLFVACSDNTSIAPKPGLAPATPIFDFAPNPANGNGACMGNDAVTANGFVSNWVSGLAAAGDVLCTSNDIDIATTTVSGYSFISAGGPFTPLGAGERITCTPGQTVFVQTQAQLENNAQDRYNIGVWIANDPTTGVQGSAVDGACLHFNLLPGVQGSTQIDGDSCGDMSSGAGLATLDLGALTIVCPAGQATVTVNNCIGWENSDLTDPAKRGQCPNIHPGGAANTISTAQGFRDGTLPETKSKCNCEPFNLPIDVRGKITIIKNTIGGNGTFAFTHDVGANSNPVVSTPFNITTVGLTGTQVIDKVVNGTYHVTESAPPSDFTFTSLVCTPNNAFASATTSGPAATITMGNGGDITCVYTNTRKTFLTLVKVVTNNNGGTKTLSDFPLSAAGPTPISGQVSGTAGATNVVVATGTYTLSEVTQAGYTASAFTCVGGDNASPVTLTTGQSATCTISNDDQTARLTLVKVVTNNNGGTKTLSDFPLSAAGPTPISGQTSGTAGATNVAVNAGVYTLSEVTVAGYTASSFACVGGNNASPLTLALGQSATCTISNDDQPAHLTLIKVVTNNNGGTKTLSDFPLSAAGPTPISGQTSGTAGATNVTVDAGVYTLSEVTQAGYTGSAFTCVGGNNSSPLTLGLNQSATCTVSNDDQPTSLTLVKVVTNNSGGTKTLSDFPLSAAGPTPINGVVSGTAGATAVPVNPGVYTLSEVTVAGYTASAFTCVGGNNQSPVTLTQGQSATCTISNDDQQAHLTLVKVVTNNSGGTKTLSDFPLSAAGPTPISGQVSGTAGATNVNVNPGVYTLSEVTQAGYTASTFTCVGGNNASPLTLALGQNATCTITNDDNQAHLTLVKVVTNNNGGTKTLSDFPLSAAGPTPISGQVSGTAGATNVNVNPGVYTLSEVTQAGYTASAFTCVGGNNASPLTLALGENATCTISNDDQTTSLTLVKVVTNNSGGTKTLSDFPLSAAGPTPITNQVSGTAGATNVGVTPGVYTLSEVTVAGYTASAFTCVGGNNQSPVTLAQGQAATCTISNDDQPAHLTLVKVVTNNSGGTKTLSDFPLSAAGPTPITNQVSGTAGATNQTVNAGVYTLSEVTVAGYTASAFTCVGGNNASPLTLGLNQSATCTVTNDDQPAHLTLVKVVTNNNGGTKTLSDFPLSAAGPTPISGQTSGTAGATNVAVNAGVYTLSEVTRVGYTASAFTCVGGNNASPLTLGLNQSATCTISNDDQPSFIIVRKISQGGVGTFTFATTGFTMPNANTLTTITPAVAVSTGQIGVNAGVALTVGEPNPPAGFQLMASECLVTQGAATIAPTQVINGVSITQGITITQPGSIVTCTFDNAVVSGTTRTQGFWSTHTGLSNTIWNTLVPTVDKQLCTNEITATTAAGTNQLMGGFWSNIAKKSNKDSRTDLEQARMQALQQYLAAVINVAQFHSQTEAFLAAARVIYCGTDVAAIKGLIGTLGSYNESGDAGVFDPGVSATAQESKKQANIPFWDVTIH